MKDEIYLGVCGHEVRHTVRDQEYFKEQGWPKPVRCRPCQREKKAAFETPEGKKRWKEEQNRKKKASPFAPFVKKRRKELA